MEQFDWQRESPFTGARNEMSFFSKLIFAIALILIAVLAYRYQSEILRFLIGPPVASVPFPQRPVAQRSVVQSPEPKVIEPKVRAQENPDTESSGQIYRCGNAYSSAPCENGQLIAQQSSRPVDRSVTKEIYLCKDFQGGMTWESAPCSVNGRFIDRIARVPANVSWDEQVAIAKQQRDKAHAIAAEQVVPVARRSTASDPSECQMLDQRIRALDAECRVNACGMDKLDSVRFARKEAQDRKFRIGC